MLGRLGSTMQTLWAIAALICALCLTGPSASHAAASTMSGTDDASRAPCNEVCKAYMAWSDRVSAMFHPSSPVAQTAGKPAGQMVHRRASPTRQSGLNAFAQFPVRRDATALSAEPAPIAVAPSRPLDEIAERFPTTAGFVTALLASTAGATNEAPESPVVSVSDTIPAAPEISAIDDTAGRDMRLALSLLLALCALSAFVVWGWFRGTTQTALR